MRNSKVRLLVQLFFALAASVAYVPSVTAAKPALPFKAIISISELLLPPTAECLFVGSISGTGQVSHLGRVEIVSHDCITQSPSGVLSFKSPRLVITTVNGDQVFANYQGTFDATQAPAVVNGYFEIDGGTGRFLNATGTGSLQGLEDISTNPAVGQIQLNGTISY